MPKRVTNVNSGHPWTLPCLCTATSHASNHTPWVILHPPHKAFSLQTKSWKEGCFQSLSLQLHMCYLPSKGNFTNQCEYLATKNTVLAFGSYFKHRVALEPGCLGSDLQLCH
uniref:Uncharacterized protein n=1 Tax=Monodon monoceros TaxID=40151 RepID=A0A8C6C8D7_MONMO